mgnify:CR=1 FL=1
MKTKNTYFILVAVILFIAGCIPSLHPIYHDEDRIEVPEIVGKWLDDSKNIWEFQKVQDEPSYILTYIDQGKLNDNIPSNDSANILVNIIKLGGTYIMDFYPNENQHLENLNDFLQIHLLGVHTFGKLEIKDGKPSVFMMDREWIEKLFDENKIRIKHEVIDGDAVLTASTDDLQKFFTKYVNDKDAFDALAACLPAGTVSGAPKVRAMEIIDELERHRRGPYAGAVGYIDYVGNMDTCIALRTFVIKDDKLYVQAGAGIVADSHPEMEYQETLNKARGLLKAVEITAKRTTT